MFAHSVTKTGKRTIRGFFRHKITTVSRFYKQIFSDQARQQLINMLCPPPEALSARPASLTIRVCTIDCSFEDVF
jgi:hypothetical protein